MAYTPTQWATGDTVTATKLNKLEQGVANAGSALICTCSFDGDDYVLDKTVAEIYDAYTDGTPIYIHFIYGTQGTYEDYVATQWLMPISELYNYNYQNEIRIGVSRAFRQLINGVTQWVPAVTLFGASDAGDCPVFLRTVFVSANVSTDGGIY